MFIEIELNLENILWIFPNLTYLLISFGRNIRNPYSLTNFKKLKTLSLNRTLIDTELKNELVEKGVFII